MPSPFSFALFATVPLLAHADMQSAFEPKGENAAQIADLAWVLFVGGGLIFIAVMALAGVTLFGRPALRSFLGRRKTIIGGGIVFPVAALSALLVYSHLPAGKSLRAEEPAAARIEVTGELWWWRVKYLDGSGNAIFETANEIRIPVGQPVDFILKTADVIHSFWIPNLAGKIDMVPGHVNRLRVRAEAPGVFRGQCAEYCGAQHARMAFYVVAHTPAEFAAWTAAQAVPAIEPADSLLQRGKQSFLANGCGHCHTVRGTPAIGKLGPDLTHAGSRLSIAAGVLPNNVGAFAGWIAASQRVKPENKMPSFEQLPAEDLRAIAAYMESLQ